MIVYNGDDRSIKANVQDVNLRLDRLARKLAGSEQSSSRGLATLWHNAVTNVINLFVAQKSWPKKNEQLLDALRFLDGCIHKFSDEALEGTVGIMFNICCNDCRINILKIENLMNNTMPSFVDPPPSVPTPNRPP